MAKISNGINDGFRGKVGTVVGYMWRGQWCMRAKPRFYHDAKTEAQLEHRALFKATVAYAGQVKEVLHVGLHRPALDAHKTECNYFLKINNGCFSMSDYGLVIFYEILRVSEGPVAPVAFRVPEWVDERTVTVAFEKNPERRRANSDDKVYVAVFNATSGEATLSLPVYRRMKSITVALPEGWERKDVYLYGFVQDNDGRTSDSVCLNEIREEDYEETGDEASVLPSVGSLGLGDADGEPRADGLVEAQAVHVVEGG